MSRPLVLCYHAVSERWPAPLSVTPAALERQLGLLVRRGYRGATFAEVASGTASGKVVAVTFDDAYRSVIELGRPVLDRLGLPGTVFAPTAYVGQNEAMVWPGIDQWLGGEHEEELLCMSWDQLGELADSGWEIGSHTRTHPKLTQLDASALADELRGSREDCERGLGRPCPTLAYPYGDWNSHVARATGEAGYSYACTLPSRLHDAAPLSWPRVGIYHADDDRRFRLKVSPLVQRLRATRAWGALRPG